MNSTQNSRSVHFTSAPGAARASSTLRRATRSPRSTGTASALWNTRSVSRATAPWSLSSPQTHEQKWKNSKPKTSIMQMASSNAPSARGKRTDEGPSEYGLAAMCLGDEVMHDLMVCGTCTERMQSLISPETRERWDRFVGENFPCAPTASTPTPSGVPVF